MTKYDENSIEVLEDLEHIRVRPGMYIGTVDHTGIFQLLKECVNNSVDEYLAGGYATYIQVYIDTERHIFRVADNGRGIPLGRHPKTGISTLTTVLTSLQAGGKFNAQAYAISAGLHGVGLKATNALSEWLDARVWKNKKCYLQSFHRGKYTKKPARDPENDGQQWRTHLTFRPDPLIFKKHRIDTVAVRSWLQETSHLCPGLKIELIVDGESEIFVSGGLGQLVTEQALTHKVDLSHNPIIYTNEDNTIQIALAWALQDDDTVGTGWWSFVNASSTREHGTHVIGVKSAIAESLRAYSKTKLDLRDILDGLYAAVHVLISEPQFKSQTKDSLLNSEVTDIVYNEVWSFLKAYFDSNKQVATQIIERAIQLKEARESYKRKRNAINKVTIKKGARGVLPDKLAEAPFCKAEDRELFIVEGDCLNNDSLLLTDSGFFSIGENLEGYSIVTPLLKNVIADKWHHLKCDKTYVIKTRYGHTVECSARHPLAIINDKLETSWIGANSLKVGDYVFLKLGGAQFREKPLLLNFKFLRAWNRTCSSCAYLKEDKCIINNENKAQTNQACYLYEFSRRMCPICGKKYARLDLHLRGSHNRELAEFDLPQEVGILPKNNDLDSSFCPKEMSNDLAVLLGYLVSEGTVGDMSKIATFRMCNSDYDVLTDYCNCFYKVFNHKLNWDGKSWDIRIRNRVISQFLMYVGLTPVKSREKVIPWSILHSTKQHLISFLSALFEGDAWSGKRTIEYYSSSVKLLNQLQQVLLGLGIHTSRKSGIITHWYSPKKKKRIPLPKPYEMGKIRISGQDFDKFHAEIGFRCTRKSNYVVQNSKYCKINAIPYIRDFIYDLEQKYRNKGPGSKTKHKSRKWELPDGSFIETRLHSYRVTSSALSFNTISDRIIKEIGYYSKDAQQTLQFAKEENLFSDEIVSIELNEKVSSVYDITVPTTHCFFANGFLSHNSAAGSARRARDADFQEVLPLRGKIPNSARWSVEKLLDNKEIAAMITAIGAKIAENGESNDFSKIRVGKVMLLADSDWDGSHIESLLLTFFTIWLPELIKQGMLYIVNSPVFVGTYKNNHYFSDTLEGLSKQSGVETSKMHISKLKGHGESSWQNLKEYAMNPETRKLWKVEYTEGDHDIILNLMGAESEARKVLLGI